MGNTLLDDMNKPRVLTVTEAVQHYVKKNMASPKGALGAHLGEMLDKAHLLLEKPQMATRYLEDQGCTPVDGGGWMLPTSEEIMLIADVPPSLPENIDNIPRLIH